MPSLERVLREEIRRLARKEAKTQLDAVKRTTAQHRKEIATLRRQLDGLEKRCTFLESQERKRLSSKKINHHRWKKFVFLPVPSARIVAASTCPPRTMADCSAYRPKRSTTGNEA